MTKAKNLQLVSKTDAEQFMDKNATEIKYGSTADHSPEALFISALVDSGKYIPGIYGIKSEQIIGHKPVHMFCMKHQEQCNEAPSVAVLKQKYPKFPYIENANPQWAASELSDAHTNRVLRIATSSASESLAEYANDQAVSILQAGLQKIQPAVGMGVDMMDLSYLDNQSELQMCPVPKGMLTTVTGGIASGDLWFVAARLGIGKSWRLIQHAIAAQEAGWNVAFFSLEMSAAQVMDRMHRVVLKDFKEPWFPYNELTVEEKAKRNSLLDKWSQKHKNLGIVSLFDPSKGRCDASVISSVSDVNTLIIVDYVGLMHTSSGVRAIEDWRAMATISNQLKEVALNRNVPIIAAAQINRSGAGSDRTPGAEHLAQSDALGQDADALVMLKKDSKRVMVNSLTKYRHGESGAKWYTQFEPAKAKLDDLSIERAMQLKMEDDENELSQLG